ncbi:DUF2259 domain-containing protein [Rhizobium halophytocola]|uniref:Secreted protein n=1 Tax=Rhizobium halophytocola TaxID=735519 RepID=A0ABS4DZE0_9HYPH|nr:DUF2259 domain-containing protein [Rhizobium halophytocola]MBP1851045.1 putative secreted protein [Rhizobium halophytocola]
MRSTGKRVIAILIGVWLGSAGAHAADIAHFSPLGFSADGKVFAFEQFGVQDGSGFPYSDIFFVNTDNDTFVAGTPLRLRIDNESATLSDARRQNMDKARDLIDRFAITDHPGQLVALNPFGELDNDPHELRYRAVAADPPFGGAYRLSLEEFDQEPPAGCENLAETIKGFRLRLTETDGKTSDVLLHEDGPVPKSRNCPLGYRIAGAMTYHEGGESTVQVALVMVISQGFEGHDGRWIAVPFRP